LYLSDFPLLENPPLKKVEPKFCYLLKKERGGAKVLLSFTPSRIENARGTVTFR